MLKAYDTFLLSEVSADLASKAGSFEPYRYECAHCGEEVRLAAADSNCMVPHFRHRNGNSDVECEYYLGQNGLISTDAHSRKSKNERAEFYFDSNIKMFFLGLRFSADEISIYEQQDAYFELRIACQAGPFFRTSINSRKFAGDIQQLIPLEKFSYQYFLSNTLNDVKRKYEVFSNIGNNKPTFFKIQVGDGGNKAKLVRGKVLYTNVSYFVAYKHINKYFSPLDILFNEEVEVEDSFEFETMGEKFTGKILKIKSITDVNVAVLQSWDYKLETSETLTILWPPSVSHDDTVTINTNKVYLYSTFELQAHGNINIHSKDISKISERLSEITIQSRIKVYKKNTELLLEMIERKSDEYMANPVIREVLKKYIVTKDDTYLFNRLGVSKLSRGMSLIMPPKSEVRHYYCGYLDEVVTPVVIPVLSGDNLIQEALKYYKRTEVFNLTDFDSLDLSQTAFQYFKLCGKSGEINSAVKYFIEEGRI